METEPNYPVPRTHADLSISRFPLMPVNVPARGDLDYPEALAAGKLTRSRGVG